MSENVGTPGPGEKISHPRLTQLSQLRQQQKQEAEQRKARFEECRKWAEEYGADMRTAADAMDALRGNNPKTTSPVSRGEAWVESVMKLGEVVGKRCWQPIILLYAGPGAVPEIAELICLVADGEIGRADVSRELTTLASDGVLAKVDWQYPFDEWRRGISGQFHEARSLAFPDLHPASCPQPAVSGLPESDDPGKTETEPSDPAKPSEDRMNDILAAIHDKEMPLTAKEIQQGLALNTPGKLRANLSWMVKNRKLQHVVRKGYWLPDVPVPR